MSRFKVGEMDVYVAGAQSRMFRVFHDAGYKGLYGSMGMDAIRAHKAIPASKRLMDRMNARNWVPTNFA